MENMNNNHNVTRCELCNCSMLKTSYKQHLQTNKHKDAAVIRYCKEEINKEINREIEIREKERDDLLELQETVEREFNVGE